MSAEQWDRWRVIRERGERAYILRYGVVYWGVSMAVLFSLAPILNIEFDHLWWFKVLLAWVLFPLGGYYYGRWMWKFMEQKYREERRLEQEP
jgi:hypothetical protein